MNYLLQTLLPTFTSLFTDRNYYTLIFILVVSQLSTVVPSADNKNSSKSRRSAGSGSSSVVTPVVVAVAVTMVAIILIIVLVYLRKKHILISRTGKG